VLGRLLVQRSIAALDRESRVCAAAVADKSC
jgi:hypothetical protein